MSWTFWRKARRCNYLSEQKIGQQCTLAAFYIISMWNKIVIDRYWSFEWKRTTEKISKKKKEIKFTSGKESKLHICFNELFDYLLHVLIIIPNRLRASKIRFKRCECLVVRYKGWARTSCTGGASHAISYTNI